MPAIPFPLSTAPGVNPTESGGRLINCFAEPMGKGARSAVRYPRSAGLKPAFQLSEDTARGAVLVDNQLYVANGDKVDVITKSDGAYTVTTESGTMPGSGLCFMARNMNATPQILIVHSDGMSQISGGTVSDFSDSDLPSVNSLSYQDSYFIVTSLNGKAYASAVNDVTFASTDKASAEGATDGLLRAIPSGRDQLLMGTTSIEVWANTGNATGYPFSRSTVIRLGLWGIYAVAGWEEGFPGNVMFVASDNTVCEMQGYTPVPISNPDLEALIAEVEDRTEIEASVYVSRGQGFFVISSADWTWEFNTKTRQWNERKSLGKTRWRAHMGIRAFDEWLVFDAETNDVYRIDPTFARENADQLVWETRSAQAHNFPSKFEIRRADFDLLTGTGLDAGINPIETDPQVQISWSFDGGKTFGNPVFRALGTQGARRQITVRNCGTTKGLGVQYRLQIADPVDVALYGAGMDIAARAA